MWVCLGWVLGLILRLDSVCEIVVDLCLVLGVSLQIESGLVNVTLGLGIRVKVILVAKIQFKVSCWLRITLNLRIWLHFDPNVQIDLWELYIYVCDLVRVKG